MMPVDPSADEYVVFGVYISGGILSETFARHREMFSVSCECLTQNTTRYVNSKNNIFISRGVHRHHSLLFLI